MNCLDACKPLLVHVAHLSLSGADAQFAGRPGDAARDIGQLVAETRAALRHCDDEARRLAWFAVNSWLAERLAPLPFAKETAPFLDPLPVDAGETFFRNLRNLLQPPAKTSETQRYAILEVYAACLELGYSGCGTDENERVRASRYRTRCREALTEKRPARPAVKPPSSGWAGTRAGMAVMWLLPMALTILLYAVYRTVLSQTFQSVLN